MRKIILFSIVFMLCIGLSGCVYSSANLMRAQGKEINVLGAWGWVNCKESSVTLYRSTDAISYPKDPNTKYPKIPARPTIQEESEAASFNVGKPAALKPKDATPDSGGTSIIGAIAGQVIK